MDLQIVQAVLTFFELIPICLLVSLSSVNFVFIVALALKTWLVLHISDETFISNVFQDLWGNRQKKSHFVLLQPVAVTLMTKLFFRMSILGLTPQIIVHSTLTIFIYQCSKWLPLRAFRISAIHFSVVSAVPTGPKLQDWLKAKKKQVCIDRLDFALRFVCLQVLLINMETASSFSLFWLYTSSDCIGKAPSLQKR